MKKKADVNQLGLLEQVQAPQTCGVCGGTILAPTIGGVPRGTCRCARGGDRFTDWSAEQVRQPRVSRGKPLPCCFAVIERYESVDREQAEIAKQRGGVALFCNQCECRVTFDGKWYRETLS